MGISAYSCSLLCLDADGNPLTPVWTYADTRSATDARELRSHHDEMAVLQRTGCRIRANYLPSRIAWIRRTMPDLFSRARWFVSLSDFICLRLFGEMRAGVSVSSWSGLLNRDTNEWDADWLAQLRIEQTQLPPLAHGEWLAGLRAEWRERWGCLRDVRCLPAVGDGAAANIGSGCYDDQRIAITIGSTAALRIVRAGRTPVLPAALWCYRVDDPRELVGGATTEGGNVFAWLRDTMRLPDDDALEQAVSAVAPDAHGLTVLPLFAGERSPAYSEHSRATIHGLTFDTSPAHIARACLEAIAYRLAQVHEPLRALAHHDAYLVASGGALLASPTWRQIIADATGSALRICLEPEATSRGVALLVLERLGVIDSVAGLPAQMGQPIYPDRARHAVYRAAAERQQALYARLVVA
jgi:gluconokinase